MKNTSIFIMAGIMTLTSCGVGIKRDGKITSPLQTEKKDPLVIEKVDCPNEKAIKDTYKSVIDEFSIDIDGKPRKIDKIISNQSLLSGSDILNYNNQGQVIVGTKNFALLIKSGEVDYLATTTLDLVTCKVGEIDINLAFEVTTDGNQLPDKEIIKSLYGTLDDEEPQI